MAAKAKRNERGSVKLKFFQEVGRDFLASRTRALLADEMRLGKTWQAITACDLIGANKILVVCPAVVRSVWANTFQELSSRRATIISYDEARSRRAQFTAQDWDVLIVDESHYCKNPAAKRTKAVLGKGGLAWKADRIWFLSGTPATNNASELWPVLRVCGLTKMGYADFTQRYCYVDWRGKPIGTRGDRVVELRTALDGFMLRRTKKQVAPELPEVSVERWKVPADTDLLGIIRPYEEDKLMQRADEQVERLKAEMKGLPAHKRAEYLAKNAKHFTEARRISAILKTPHILETIRFEIQNNIVDKLVVFGFHREPLRLLHELLKGDGIKVELVWGGTADKKRERAIEKFSRPTKKGGSRVFLGNILAAGTGIDLSAAHEGIFIEKDWVPGNNQQALERMGGFKQDNPITVRDAYLESGIDAVVDTTLTRKFQELGWLFN